MNPIYHYDIQQGTEDWHALRLGRVTGSTVKNILAGEVGRQTYLSQLIEERLTGKKKEIIITEAMQHGIDTEPQAIAQYQLHKCVDVAQIGFVELNPFVGCSPDGLVAKKGKVEAKCPQLATYLTWSRTGIIPTQHVEQCFFGLWVTGREWCDFISFSRHLFDLGMPIEKYLIVHRLYRDDIININSRRTTSIKIIEEKTLEFVDKLKVELISLGLHESNPVAANDDNHDVIYLAA